MKFFLQLTKMFNELPLTFIFVSYIMVAFEFFEQITRRCKIEYMLLVLNYFYKFFFGLLRIAKRIAEFHLSCLIIAFARCSESLKSETCTHFCSILYIGQQDLVPPTYILNRNNVVRYLLSLFKVKHRKIQKIRRIQREYLSKI